MTKQAAFWDSSALVPLCVHETTSRHAHSQLRRFLPVVWWGSLIEIHSAIARHHRLGKLRDPEKHRAFSQLGILSAGWREILPGDDLRGLAARLLDAHELRAADSLQLAAALVWCRERPARRTFLCSDQRLSKSAAAAGFSIIELS